MWVRGLSLIIFMFLFGGRAMGIEFVPQVTAKALAGDFDRARPLTESDLRKFKDQDWLCDMYGMRTRLQVERGVRLYRFAATGDASGTGAGAIASAKWKNLGAQMVREYSVSGAEFSGQEGPVVDQIRLKKDGKQLVARMSLSDQTKGKSVLAYSVCSPHSI
jgi:hypothetical protein